VIIGRAAHAAKLVPSVRDRSSRSRMNFTRIEVLAAAARNSGRVLRRATATTFSEGASPGRMVRIQEPKDRRSPSITLLKEWLVNYRFKNWHTTETRHQKVTPRMREKMAGQIAAALNKPTVWHTHSRGISMQVLRDKLKLEAENRRFQAKPRPKCSHQCTLETYMSRFKWGNKMATKKRIDINALLRNNPKADASLIYS
jgi:hypothetical protein